MRRGITRHAQAIADARSQRIRTAGAIPADRLSPDPDAPEWIRAQAFAATVAATAAAIVAPFVSAADRRRAQALALALLIVVRRIADEAQRHPWARLVAADRSRDDSPPTGVLAVAALCSAPRPGPLAPLAA